MQTPSSLFFTSRRARSLCSGRRGWAVPGSQGAFTAERRPAGTVAVGPGRAPLPRPCASLDLNSAAPELRVGSSQVLLAQLRAMGRALPPLLLLRGHSSLPDVAELLEGLSLAWNPVGSTGMGDPVQTQLASCPLPGDRTVPVGSSVDCPKHSPGSRGSPR